MAVLLNKKVHRELRSTDRKGRSLIISLEPNDMISFRPKGAKRTMSVYLGHCFNLAMILHIDHEYNESMKKYNVDRALGYKRRKPNKPSLPFSPIYLKALKG